MARYSPRDPGYTPVPGVLDALSHIATSGARGYTGARTAEEEREERDRIRRQEDEERELELYGRGFRRGRAPSEPVPEEEDIFAGEGMGMQRDQPRTPSIFQGARPGMARGTGGTVTDQALGAIADMGAQPPEPQVLALPGSYVEGLGFTPRAITDQDLVAATRARRAAPRTRPRPGTEQVTDDVYFEEAGSPEGREEARLNRRQQAERETMTAALRALQTSGGDVPPEVQAQLLESGVASSVVFPDEDEESITVEGRDFPNTPAGAAAAREWGRIRAEDRARASRTGRPPTDTTITTRRQIAMAAARAIQSIRDEVRELTSFERQRLPAGYLSEQIRQVAEQFGYADPSEVEAEMRELRLTPPPGGAGGGAGGGDPAAEGPSDEELDQLIQENPDLSPEEILELWERGEL